MCEVEESEISEIPEISYPLQVIYCGACSMPLEYCEYSGMVDECRKWLEENLPDEFQKILSVTEDGSSGSEKKHQKRGDHEENIVRTSTSSRIRENYCCSEVLLTLFKIGTSYEAVLINKIQKAFPPSRRNEAAKTTEKFDGAKTKQKSAKVTLQKAVRGKNKSVTIIKGLAEFGVDLKAAAKLFASKFACGSSVTAADEIVVQGDVKDDLIDIIASKWPQIDGEFIEDLGDQKR